MTFGEIIKQRWKPYYSYFHDFSDFITCIFSRSGPGFARDRA